MPPGYDIRRLPEPDLPRARRDRGFRQQRIWAEFRALRLKMMLGHEEVVEAEAIGQNPLPHLAHQRALTRFVHHRQVAVVDRDSRRRPYDRQVRRAIVENAYFNHMPSAPDEF